MRRADLVAMAIPTLVLAGWGWQRRWMTDDGLIFTRVVRQIAAGNGPVYNVGERAETSTSTAWQWLLVAAHYLSPLSDAENAVYLGLLLSVAGFWLALDATRRIMRGLGVQRLLLPAGAAVFAVLPPVWDFMTAGMEIGLILFWIGGSWALLVRVWERRVVGAGRLAALGVWFGIGPMIRPDLGITTVVFFAAVLLIARPGWRRAAAAVAAGVFLPAAYEIFRMGYYGVVFPMPGVTKEAGASQWGRGWDYVLDFNGPYQLWIPLLCLAVAGILLLRAGAGRGGVPASGLGPFAEPYRIVVAAPALAAALQTFYLVKVGGDFMHGRLWVPLLLLALLPALLVPLHRPVATAAVAAVLVWSVVCVAVLRPSGGATTKPPVPNAGGMNQVWNERGVTTRATGQHNPVTADAHVAYNRVMTGLLVRAHEDGRRVLMLDPRYGAVFGLPPDFALPLRPDIPNTAALVIGKLGAGGAMMPLDGLLADVWGLSSTLGAHLEQTHFIASGHQKLLAPAWNIALYADPSSFASVPSGLAAQEDIQAAYRTTQCGAVAELLASVSQPMSWDRFWSNLTGAYDRTKLRIPADPKAAERKFCGTD
ncbi:hypothetical protein [Yinghuangia soli]|uniref:Terminal beta-(1->2)-arabinofuranosyltransferase C-terminal domain-containing protein n=1 Tax=Yinghuangia soli TaxID=2908204 RepID=A0AA41U4C5_9ACTN|nr:hypothetical protein [Yinghuangia soli]MCF2532741.1 hypothetical protein [Yinghuangia soli]